MAVEINSVEYQSWHELGHAVACLHLGGDVAFVEILGDDHAGGRARARCEPAPGTRPSVLCGGFAAEYILFDDGHLPPIANKEFTQIIFKNATIDREGFVGRVPAGDENFTKAEDQEFMRHAISRVVPILRLYWSEMAALVAELASQGKVDGARIKEVLAAGAR